MILLIMFTKADCENYFLNVAYIVFSLTFKLSYGRSWKFKNNNLSQGMCYDNTQELY